MSESPLFRVIRGNPTDTELAALSTVIHQKLAAAAAAKRSSDSTAEANLWGRFEDRLARHTRFNAAAFTTVTFT